MKLHKLGLILAFVAILFVGCNISLPTISTPTPNPDPNPNQNPTPNPTLVPDLTPPDGCSDCRNKTAYDYYNKLLNDAGLLANTPNHILEQAAQSHSNYLRTHNLTGHIQQSNKEGFTGQTPSDRATHFGFNSKSSVGEGVSSGDSSVTDALDGLMSAIYHRFGILRFDANVVGIGVAISSFNGFDFMFFTHNPANVQFNELCTNDQHTIGPGYVGTYYSAQCKDGVKQIKESSYLSARDQTSSMNPKHIVWPPDNSTDSWTTFKDDEFPDPLPDKGETGYPVSIQFNPYHYPTAPTVTAFKLFDNNGVEISDTRLLSKATDVHAKFDDYEYALFPLSPLGANTQYSVSVTFTSNSTEEVISWQFTTGNTN